MRTQDVTTLPSFEKFALRPRGRARGGQCRLCGTRVDVLTKAKLFNRTLLVCDKCAYRIAEKER
jgi:hypothetical protein